jgi:hypothetical protein
MSITQGKVTASIDASVYDADRSLRGRLHAALNSRFLGVQLITHKPYTLHDPSLLRIDENGKQHRIVELQGVLTLGIVGSADFVIRTRTATSLSTRRRSESTASCRWRRRSANTRPIPFWRT